MGDPGNRGTIPAAAILGACLALGLAIGGYFIGKGAVRFRSDVRTVTVKGLVEREVKADQAVWELSFRRGSNDLRDAYGKISVDRAAGLDFLKRQGFREEEITVLPVRTLDKLAREFDTGQGAEILRYVATASVLVVTDNVDAVTRSLGATEELLRSGVVLDSSSEGGKANPRYVVTGFNALRPSLLAEATKNARATAQQFASDAGARVGRIRAANQGSIQIFGSDGNDESAPYSPTSTPSKKIRVVSTFEFELE